MCVLPMKLPKSNAFLLAFSRTLLGNLNTGLPSLTCLGVGVFLNAFPYL